jgi:hypothetical protein
MAKWYEQLRIAFKQIRCEHFWRPARTSRGLARYCEDCDRTESLSEPEYYSQFGRFAQAKPAEAPNAKP